MVALLKDNFFKKFLGVIIYENLSWKKHISIFGSKLSRAIGVLYKARSFINEKSRKRLYFSLIHSHLNYANIAWGRTHVSKLNKLHRLQKNTCKVVKCKGKYDSSGFLMKEMNGLNIFNMNLMQHLIFMYKFKNGQLPQNFLKYFRTSESERYNLRSNKSDSFYLPFKQSKFTEHSIFFIEDQNCGILFKKKK